MGELPAPDAIASSVAQTRELLPIVPKSVVGQIQGLPRVASRSEADVYRYKPHDAVYKVVRIQKDATVDGVVAGQILGLKDGGTSIRWKDYPIGSYDPTIAEYVRDQIDPVLHGSAVYTEPVGISEDGKALIFKQPFVEDIYQSETHNVRTRNQMLKQLGITPIGEGGKAGIGTMPDGRLILFVDMHHENLVYGYHRGEGTPPHGTRAYLVDASARVLSPEETRAIHALLSRQQGMGQSSFSIAPRPMQYTYTDIGHSKGNDLWIMSPEGELITEEDSTGDQVHMVMPEALDSPIRGWVDHGKRAISMTIGLDPMRWSQLERDRAITSAYRQFQILHPDYNVFEYGTEPTLAGPRFSIRRTPSGKMVEAEFYQDDTLRDAMGFYSPIRDWLSKSS
jgi:hypothetical protein